MTCPSTTTTTIDYASHRQAAGTSLQLPAYNASWCMSHKYTFPSPPPRSPQARGSSPLRHISTQTPASVAGRSPSPSALQGRQHQRHASAMQRYTSEPRSRSVSPARSEYLHASASSLSLGSLEESGDEDDVDLDSLSYTPTTPSPSTPSSASPTMLTRGGGPSPRDAPWYASHAGTGINTAAGVSPGTGRMGWRKSLPDIFEDCAN